MDIYDGGAVAMSAEFTCTADEIEFGKSRSRYWTRRRGTLVVNAGGRRCACVSRARISRVAVTASAYAIAIAVVAIGMSNLFFPPWPGQMFPTPHLSAHTRLVRKMYIYTHFILCRYSITHIAVSLILQSYNIMTIYTLQNNSGHRAIST